MSDRKFLVIGLGSMGKRRVRCLQFLGHYDIVGYDIRPDRLQEAQTHYGIATIADLDALDLDAITHVIISTPPDAHLGYASQMHAMGKHVFIEASVVDDGYADLAAALPGRPNVLAPSCTMRFDPLNRRVKAWLEEGVIGDALFCQHHFGMYLPKWHPYESISYFYVSKAETGAGREIVPFDLVYLSWFFGLPQDIRGHIDRTGHIDAPIDDVYALTFRTPRCRTVQMTIDVVSQVPYRTTRIVGTKGNIEIDTVKGTLALYTEPTQSWRLLTRAQLAETTAAEEMYVTEMNCFLEAAAGGAPFPYTLNEDWAVLKALYEAERGIAGPIS
jgi:predicted dehydrogenase